MTPISDSIVLVSGGGFYHLKNRKLVFPVAGPIVPVDDSHFLEIAKEFPELLLSRWDPSGAGVRNRRTPGLPPFLTLRKTSTRTAFLLQLPVRTYLSLDILDARGRRLKRVFAGPLGPGRESLGWDGRAPTGRQARGPLFYRLRTEQGQWSGRL